MQYRKTIDTDEALAAWYEAKYAEMGGGWHTPEAELIQHQIDARIQPKQFVLDVGCGTGQFVIFLRNQDVRSYGFDIALRDSNDTLLQPINICDPRTHYSFEDSFDRVVSLGSLEHVSNLEIALHNIHEMLAPKGRWYFLVPNELWQHTDQPNERTATDAEWIALFAAHGLQTDFTKRWNDQTAFGGTKL